MRRLVSLILLSGISASVCSDAGVPFNGKSGQALLESVASASRPSGEADMSALTYTVTDRFSGREVSVSAGRLPDGYVWSSFVPVEWWTNAPAAFEGDVTSDIFNLLPLEADAARARGDLPPGTVTAPVFSNAFWSAGRGEIYGVLTDIYSPPVELRGELARAYFYMAVVHHADVWTPRAYMMFTSEPFPGLSAYAIPLLMAWHRAAPPSAAEMERNMLAERLQGNRNPFVDYPELAEHVWGDRQGDKFVIAGEPQPLRSVYKLDTDVIDLVSPWIPADAVWCIDGQVVSAASVAASDLGPGNHRLTYHSPSTREEGFVMIKIEK